MLWTTCLSRLFRSLCLPSKIRANIGGHSDYETHLYKEFRKLLKFYDALSPACARLLLRV
jgi:hypothetical protein